VGVAGDDRAGLIEESLPLVGDLEGGPSSHGLNWCMYGGSNRVARE